MIVQLIIDDNYTVHDTDSPNWFRVLFDKKLLALAMSLDTARQVIYRDIHEKGGTCEYLVEDDFIVKSS